MPIKYTLIKVGARGREWGQEPENRRWEGFGRF